MQDQYQHLTEDEHKGLLTILIKPKGLLYGTQGMRNMSPVGSE